MCASRHQTSPTCEAAVAGVGGLVMTDEILFWRVGRIASMLHLVVGRSNWRKWSCRMVRSIPFSLLFALVQISLFNQWRLCLEVCYVVFGLSESYVLLVRGMIVQQSKTVQDEMVG